MDEINVLKDLDNPHIVHVWDHFESRDKCVSAARMETSELRRLRGRGTGTDMPDTTSRSSWLLAASSLTVSPRRAASLRRTLLSVSGESSGGRWTRLCFADAALSQVLVATSYLHSKNIVHRDLKPENILYKTRDESSPIVIADFGIAKHLDSADEEVTSMAGSFGYAAPEVLLGKPHGLKVDMWSIGVITYTLLCGYSPFRSDDKNELIRETTKGKVTFHERFWKHVSETARDFIRRLLVVDPKDRMSAAEALNHPWMKGSDGEDYDLSANIRENFNPRKKWKDAFRVIQASNKFKMAAAGAAHQAKPEPLDTDSSESEGFRTAESDEDTKVQGAGTARKAGGGGGLAGLVGQAKAKAAADTGLEASVQSLKVE